jgi:hypothetical protein
VWPWLNSRCKSGTAPARRSPASAWPRGPLIRLAHRAGRQAKRLKVSSGPVRRQRGVPGGLVPGRRRVVAALSRLLPAQVHNHAARPAPARSDGRTCATLIPRGTRPWLAVPPRHVKLQVRLTQYMTQNWNHPCVPQPRVCCAGSALAPPGDVIAGRREVATPNCTSRGFRRCIHAGRRSLSFDMTRAPSTAPPSTSRMTGEADEQA